MSKVRQTQIDNLGKPLDVAYKKLLEVAHALEKENADLRNRLENNEVVPNPEYRVPLRANCAECGNHVNVHRLSGDLDEFVEGCEPDNCDKWKEK